MPKRKVYVSSMRRRVRGRIPPRGKSRFRIFSRRAYTAPGLLPESKYVDSYYANSATFGNAIGPAAGAGTVVMDANGPATLAADLNAGGAAPGAIGIRGGAGFNQRIGRKIFLKYMAVRARVYFPSLEGVAAAAVPSQHVRLMLFYDRQPNLQLPLAADMMNVNSGMTTLTFQEDRNRERFVRLWDHTVNVTCQNGPATNNLFLPESNVIINKNIKINGSQVYNDTAEGGISAIQTGSLVWLFMWEEGIGGTEACWIDLSTRLRYSDL